MRGAPLADRGRRLPRVDRRGGDGPCLVAPGPRAVGGDRAHLQRPRPPRRAGPLRPARRLGRALRAACACRCACASTSSASTATRRSQVAREGAGTPRVLARVRRDATDAIASYLRILVVVVVGSALGFGLLVALALRGIGLPLRAGALSAVATRAGARRRHHRAAAAPRRSRRAGVLRPRPGHPARAARGRVGRGERRCARRRARRPARRPRPAGGGARRARAAGRAPADHRRLGPAQQPAGGAGAAARRARDAAVLRRRPHRPRLAAGVPADQRRPARGHAAWCS